MVPPSMSFGSTSTRAEIKLRSVSNLMKIDKLNCKFPGPLIPYSKPPLKSKKKDVEKWMKEKIVDLEGHLHEKLSQNHCNKRYEHRILLFKVVGYLLQNDGSISLNETSLKDLRHLLCPDLTDATNSSLHFSSVSQIYSKPSQSDQNSRANGGLEKVLNNKDSADLYNYLRLGEKENAIRYAMDKGYWAHALLIASAVSPAHWSNTVEEFVKENIRPLESPNASNIAFLYKLFGGSGAEAVGELTASRGPVSLSKAYDRPVDNWCDILWLALSNITPQSGSAIVALGDSLLGTGMIEAAHICFILSGIPGFGLPEEQVGSFSLLGSDRRYSAAQFGCDTDSIILSEVYEFCLSLRNDVSFVPVINNLLYKSYLTTVLADHGLFTEARRYNDAVLAGIKSIPKGLSITPSFINTVQNLSQRLLESPADSSSNWLVGKLSKPNLENVWGTIDKNLSKFVTGDDASSKTEFQEREKGIFGHYSRAQSAADIPSIVNLTNTTNTATSGVSMSLYSATTSPGYSSSANLYPAGSQNQSKYNRPFEQDEANMPLYMNTVPSANRASLTVSPIARPTQHDMSLPTGASSVGPKGSDTQPALTSYGSGDSSTLSTGTSAIYNPYAPAKLTESGKLEHATQSYVSEGYVDKTGPNISLASTANTMYNPYAPVSGHESKSEAGYQPVTTTVRQSTTTSGSNLSLPSLSRAPDVSSQFISEKHQYSSPNLGMPSHPVNPYAPTFEPKMPSNYSPYAVSSPGPVQARPVLPYNNAESASDIHSHVPPEPLDRNETSYSLPRPSTATTPVNKLFKASSSNQSLRSLSSHNIRQNISSGSQIEIPESELKPMNRENSLSSVHHLYGLENQGITLIDSGELNDPPIEPKDSHFSKSNLTPSPSYGSTEQPVQLSHIGTRNEIDESRGDEGSFDYISHADENSSIVERPYDSTEGFEDRNRYELREEFCPASIHSPSSISYVPSESGGEIVNGEGNQSSQLNNDGDMSEHVTLNLSKSPLNPYAPISNTSKFTNSYTPEISSYNPYSPIPKSESGGNYTPQNYAPQESVKYVEENLAENLSTPYEDSGYNPYSALYGSTADGDNTGSISEKDGLCVESEVNPEYTVTTPTYETRMLEEVEQVVNISEPVYQQPSYGIEADEEPSTASSDSYNGGDFFTPLSSSSVYAPMAMNTGVIPKVVPLSQSSARTPVVREDEDEEVEDLGFSNKPKKLESEKKKENEAEKKKADEEKKGWFGGWFHKKGDQQNVVKAKLGEESSFYYDEKLKRWVNKNASAEEETVNVGPPPPPMKVSSANSGVTSPSASSLPPASLAPLPPAIPKPKISTTGGLDDLLSVAPPLGGARKPVKKNARSRYVDVLNP
ncbi:hypothetical protein NADFUDRAFT_81212 [Nadsonia fulvescens var. elongata DSM 6958]|uniref:Protein transport protein sec16 n=1 Tax=Nadsonia fulvescens var. elongata DSM 6958 TaxID=857566 RepID=A0A1E3PTB2_9ASCO|nr:hypothetical protein NADFUDRAFT_81212 [Nadsonia fulvescens var. elongata DSM 6958]